MGRGGGRKWLPTAINPIPAASTIDGQVFSIRRWLLDEQLSHEVLSQRVPAQMTKVH
jgi:hypothetical protein